MRQDLDRRQFVSRAAGFAAAPAIVPRHVLGGAGYAAPSERMNLAGIGIGGMGAANLKNLETENIVALCDVDRTYAAKTIAAYPRAKFYFDYRDLLNREKGLDGVVIATPDHTHAVIAQPPCGPGSTYCQAADSRCHERASWPDQRETR